MTKAPNPSQLFQSVQWDDLLRAGLLILIGLVLARLYQRMLHRGLLNQLPHFGRRLGNWLILGLFAVAALHQLGFNLSVLLGAAGVLSVAIGFAAQTSAANIISGLFVVSEGSFHVGDVIQVGGNVGEVLAVDMLSVKLRTPDNRYVRIPNETIIKSDLVNLSKFPIRRIDIKLSIAYDSDLALARKVLSQVAEDNPLCLEEPQPQINLEAFAESSVDLQFQFWTARANFRDLRDNMQEEIKLAFDHAGIEFPFPHRTVYLKSEQLAAVPAAIDSAAVGAGQHV